MTWKCLLFCQWLPTFENCELEKLLENYRDSECQRIGLKFYWIIL